MIYRLFLYKTRGFKAIAPVIDMTARAFKNREFYSNDLSYGILTFDTEKVKAEIEKLSSSDSGTALCKVFAEKAKNNKKYIKIVTSYDKIKEVINTVYFIAVKYGLELYDAEKDRSYFHTDLFDERFVTAKMRTKEIRDRITEGTDGLWRIKKLAFYDEGYYNYASYCVTLVKIKGIPFEKRVTDFYSLLLSSLKNGEELITSDRCFTVKSEYYEITYCLEGYKKDADKIGYMENGEPKTVVLHRMSCEKAFKWASDNLKCDVSFIMNVYEMKEYYPNPADRFVKIINIMKQDEKEKYFSVSHFTSIGGSLNFKVVDAYGFNEEETSLFSIDETDMGPVFTVVKEFYPYLSERYYDRNHIPAEMMRDIVDKAKEIRELIINDTFNEKLKPYVDKNDFYSLQRKDSDDDIKLFNDNFIQYLYKRRYDAVRIYDVFIEWAETQLDLCWGGNYMFSVEGP